MATWCGRTLSRGLGFSKEDRDTNIRRIGYVASEIVRHGGMVICAAISPYRATREDVRNLVGAGFFEIHMATPLEYVEARDIKGTCTPRRAAAKSKDFTGIDDPYEPPLQSRLYLDRGKHAALKTMRACVVARLIELGFDPPGLNDRQSLCPRIST